GGADGCTDRATGGSACQYALAAFLRARRPVVVTAYRIACMLPGRIHIKTADLAGGKTCLFEFIDGMLSRILLLKAACNNCTHDGVLHFDRCSKLECLRCKSKNLPGAISSGNRTCAISMCCRVALFTGPPSAATVCPAAGRCPPAACRQSWDRGSLLSSGWTGRHAVRGLPAPSGQRWADAGCRHAFRPAGRCVAA